MSHQRYYTPRTNNNNNNKNNKSKKRKRQEKLQEYGVDLPDIPGVSIEIIPLLVHALKMSTKFFQHQTKTPYSGGSREDNNNGTTTNNNDDDNDDDHLLTTAATRRSDNNNRKSDALDSLLNRIESSANNEANKEKQQQEQREIKMNDAIQSWIQAIKRLAKDNNYHHPAQQQPQQPPSSLAAAFDSNNQNNAHHNYKKSQPLCCFHYIWNLGKDHKRLAVRRAALYMNRHLLDKSADYRRFFLQDDNHLWDWVQMLVTRTTTTSTSTTTSTTTTTTSMGDDDKQRLWQKEGHRLLLHLLRQQYDDLYPKLIVSERYLQQACMLSNDKDLKAEEEAASEEGTRTTMINTNMASLRQLRDIAMQHGDEETKRVQRLIHRCYKCMDILVPRLGDIVVDEEEEKDKTNHTTTNSVKKQKTDSNDHSMAIDLNGAFGTTVDNDDDDEEDDIDWEDGWEDDEENGDGGGGGDNQLIASSNNKKNENATEQRDQVSHALAVERTLQAMESIGVGVSRSGGIEIDFGGDKTTPASSTMSDPLLLGPSTSAATPTAAALDNMNTTQGRDARKRFIKCAKLLSERHLPRIRAWLEGLQNADRLSAAAAASASTSAGRGSLILMSPQQGKHREEIRQQLMEVKAKMLSVLESAARLGLIGTGTKKKTNEPSIH